MTDYYKTLELEKSATPEEIKANYRRLAMKWHPDRNGGSAEAEEKFKNISEAYSVLSDESKRRDYDQFVASGGQNEAAYRSTNPGFSPEQASYMFMWEMNAIAQELAMQGYGREAIAGELMRRGCPPAAAAEIAAAYEERAAQAEKTERAARPRKISRAIISGLAGLGIFTVFGGIGFGLIGFIGLAMAIGAGYDLIAALSSRSHRG